MLDAYVTALQTAVQQQQVEIERLQYVSNHLVQAHSTLRKDHLCLYVQHHTLLDCLDQEGLLARPYLSRRYTHGYVSRLCTLMLDMEGAPHLLVSLAGLETSSCLLAASRSCLESLAGPLFEAVAAGQCRPALPPRGGGRLPPACPSLEGVLELCRALPPAEPAAPSGRSAGRPAAGPPAAAPGGAPGEEAPGHEAGGLTALLADLWLNCTLADTFWSFQGSAALQEFRVASRACGESVRMGPLMAPCAEARSPPAPAVQCSSTKAEVFYFDDHSDTLSAADDAPCDSMQGGDADAQSEGELPAASVETSAQQFPGAEGWLLSSPTSPTEAPCGDHSADSAEEPGPTAAVAAEEAAEEAVAGAGEGPAPAATAVGEAAATAATAGSSACGEAEAGAAPVAVPTESVTDDAAVPPVQAPEQASAEAADPAVPVAAASSTLASVHQEVQLEADLLAVVTPPVEAHAPAPAEAPQLEAVAPPLQPRPEPAGPPGELPAPAKMSSNPPQQPAAKPPTPPSGTIWEVVGGAEKGGLVVRAGKDLRSPVIGSAATGPKRLALGARVTQLTLRDGRLQYSKLSGDGPETGWVSTHASGKPLLQRDAPESPDFAKRRVLLDQPGDEARTSQAPAAEASHLPGVSDSQPLAVTASQGPTGAGTSNVVAEDITAAAAAGVTASGLPITSAALALAVPPSVLREAAPAQEAAAAPPPASEERGGGGDAPGVAEAAAAPPPTSEEHGGGGGAPGAAGPGPAGPEAGDTEETGPISLDEILASPAPCIGPQLPETPRVFWTYWDQGADAMPAFNKLCVETWRKTHPEWQVRVLDKESVGKWLEPGDLPPTFKTIKTKQHRADCVKSGLMVRHGGIYMDSSIMVWQDLAQVAGWEDIEAGFYDFAGYYMKEREFVENYFLAARRGCPLVKAWHKVHMEFWDTRTSVGALDKDAFFRGVRISRIDPSERTYLSQHACYMKLCDCNIDGFRDLTKRARLLDTAGPKGALWVFNRLSRMATLQAQKSYVRPPPVKRAKWMPFGNLGRGLGRGTTAGAGKGQSRGSLFSSFPPQAPRGKSWQEAMWEVLLWDDASKYKAFLDDLDRTQPPLAKFTGHAGFLADSSTTRKDLLQWKTLLRTLLLRALGQSAALPTPGGWTPS